MPQKSERIGFGEETVKKLEEERKIKDNNNLETLGKVIVVALALAIGGITYQKNNSTKTSPSHKTIVNEPFSPAGATHQAQ